MKDKAKQTLQMEGEDNQETPPIAEELLLEIDNSLGKSKKIFFLEWTPHPTPEVMCSSR